jgi:hypothetical protein
VVHVEFNVPPTVKLLSISEAGTLMNVKGVLDAFLEIQTLVP